MAEAVLGQGVLMTRLFLRGQMRRETDPTAQKAIAAALSDTGNFAGFAADLTDEGTQAAGPPQSGASPFSGLLAWLLANWKTILNAILALFGLPPIP
jgi:hypothetical protein